MRHRMRGLGVAILAAWGACAAAAERTSVRVKTVDGVPRLCVDGKPVAPRSVFVWQNSIIPREVTGEWRRTAYRFTSDYDAPRASAHFRFRREDRPLVMEIRAIRLRDLTDGKDVPLVWRAIEPEGVGRAERHPDGTLTIRLAAHDDAKGGDFHPYTDGFRLAKGHEYEYAFEAKSDVATVVKPGVYRIAPNGEHLLVNCLVMNYTLRQVKLARDAGIRFVTVGFPCCWTKPGEEAGAYELGDSLMRGILEIHPNALILPRVFANAPGWWQEAHPDSLMRVGAVDAKGKETGAYESFPQACPSSRLYRREACAYLERLGRHLSETFPRSFAGIHTSGQHSGEWFYELAWDRPLTGYDTATEAAFGRKPPTPAERRKAEVGPFFDPQGERYAFSRFQNDEMADLVAEMILAIRRGCGDDKLAVAFYGYSWELSWLQNGTAWHGHLSIERLLEKCGQELDVLCGPVSYFDRAWACSGCTMSAAETMSRHGVMWFDEDDTRTFRYPDFYRQEMESRKNDATKSTDSFVRNTAKGALRGIGSWYMDLPGCGALDIPQLWDRTGAFLPKERAVIDSGAAFRPEVALVFDEKSASALAGDWRGEVTYGLLYASRGDWARTGVPYGQYLLGDVLAKPTDAKLTVYQNAWFLTAAERARFAAVRKAGAAGVRVWCTWPGYLTEQGLSLAAMEETTGFAFTAEDPLRPSVVCAPNEAWERDEKGRAVVAARKAGAGWDVFIGKKQIEPGLCRRLADLAGCHAYAAKPGKAIVWSAGDWVSVHACEEGPIDLDFGAWGKSSVVFRKGETKLFCRGIEK